MAGDLTNFRLSSEANAVADKFVDTGYFDYAITVAKFALGYTLKNYFDEFNPATYQVTDGGGSNYSVGSLDSDGQLASLIKALYPETTTPYVYMRALINFGLIKLGEKVEKEGIQSISSYLEDSTPIRQ